CEATVGNAPVPKGRPSGEALLELCPAPGECPCAPWPSESWPCEGLLEMIVASFSITIAFEGEDYIFNGTGTLTAASATGGCYWTAVVVLDALPNAGSSSDEVGVTVRLDGG